MPKMYYAHFIKFQDKAMEELQSLVRGLETESKSLHDKIATSESEVSKLQELLTASEEKCSVLIEEKDALTKVIFFDYAYMQKRDQL